MLAKFLIINPLQKRVKLRKLAKTRREYKQQVSRNKEKAKEEQQFMHAIVQSKRQAEELIDGITHFTIC